MNFPLIAKVLGLFYLLLANTLVIPLGVCLYYGDGALDAFKYTASGTLAIGLFLLAICHRAEGRLPLRGAILMVALVWITFSLIGAVPFYLSDAVPSFVDAWFESSSGITATGATVITQIESLPKGILLWRSMSQFLGGMGVIVLSIAILPLVGVGGMDLYRAEAPGPTTDKLTARISETAKVLWIVYMTFAVVAGLSYYYFGMTPFDAINHAFTTMAAGGFSTKNASIASFSNSNIEYVASIFMFLSGISFVIHYRFFFRADRSVFKDPELRFYITVVLVAILLITISNWTSSGLGLSDSFRHSLFQVTSLASSTGYASYDYNIWSPFAQLLLILIMVLGGCAGSTAGGLKCVRGMMLIKQGIRELHQLLHPKGIIPLKLGSSSVNASTSNAIFAYFFLYLLIFVVLTLFAAASGLDLISASTSVIACLSNMGPSIGDAGPMSNYGGFPQHIKALFSATMIIGRLELFTILVLLTRDFWDS